MTATARLTIKETACLAEVPARTVEKALEAKILSSIRRKPTRPGGAQRYLPVLAVAYLAVLREAGLMELPLRHKKLLWRELKALATEVPDTSVRLKPVSLGKGITVNVDELASDEFETALKYVDGKAIYLVIDKNILGGTPVISGTRVPVYSVLARLEEGETLEDIHEDNPDISLEALETAAIYAKANPIQGRPKGRPWRSAA